MGNSTSHLHSNRCSAGARRGIGRENPEQRRLRPDDTMVGCPNTSEHALGATFLLPGRSATAPTGGPMARPRRHTEVNAMRSRSLTNGGPTRESSSTCTAASSALHGTSAPPGVKRISRKATHATCGLFVPNVARFDQRTTDPDPKVGTTSRSTGRRVGIQRSDAERSGTVKWILASAYLE